MLVLLRLADNGLWRAYARTAGLGDIVAAQGRTEFHAQASAARFMDANFPDEPVEWEGGWRGGDPYGVFPHDHWAKVARGEESPGDGSYGL